MQPTCRVCHSADRPIAPSRAKSSNWICSSCANAARNADAACYLACKLASALRKRGERAPFPGTALAREVLAKCDGRSVLSGERNVRRLCIVRVAPELPWSSDNAVLVTSAEGYALSRAGDAECRRRLLRMTL